MTDGAGMLRLRVTISVTRAAGVLALTEIDVGLMAYGLCQRQCTIKVIGIVRQAPYGG
ncbi:hypothetical protein X756_31905 [Mesorhizobium sp. LSHC412B00]|nr:hypothetical protein X756_31905 [Mesorhizobium sp. LSHC412B00]